MMKNLNSFPRKFVCGLALALAPMMMAGTAAQAQTRGGTLGLVANPEPPSIVTAMNSMVAAQYMGSKVFQGLLTYDGDLKPRPELAKSWTVSDDGLSYVFELQEGVKWHDGQPFTADDAVFTIGTLLPAVHVRTGLVLKNYLESVTAKDAHTVEIKLKKPFPPFIYMFESGTMPMMPKHLYEGTDFARNPANQKPVGTGPFRFKEWKRGSYLRLERNPDYWKPGLPYLDGVVFYMMPDAASRVVAFENGTVQVLRSGDLEVSDLKRLQGMDGVDYTAKGWELFSPTYHLQLNLRKPPFDNVKVRQAIQHALDRQFIVDVIFEGLNWPATGPFAKTELFFEKDVQQYPYDLDKARALIKESGVDVGARPVKLLNMALGGNYDRLLEYTKQMLEQIGFRVEIEASDGGTWASKVSNWDYDITFNLPYQYGDPALGVERLYVTRNISKGSPFANNQGYSNPEADALWDKAGQELDPAKRAAYYSDLQKILARDVANNWLMDIEFGTVSKSNVKNPVSSGHSLTESLDTVSIE
ncbi:ABC transporter substrate-binding protein [Kerstersia gyiorum]|uniref:ABC transporter substrate-binding protein n=2 Tax=Kerstersia gyiorum TaxID=206506 RepID=UPI0026A85656